MTTFTTDWVEIKNAELIARAKRSRWAREIFAEADYFIAKGYATDVALAISLSYWER